MTYLMTSAEFIQKAREIEKTDTAYMWGTYGRKITLALINAKVKQYPKRYTAAYIERLKTLIGKAYGWDCVGLIKGILWGWDGVKNVPYSVNGVPDTNVMGFYAKGENKSTDFSKIVPGAAVHLPTHVGIYIGDGLVIEATSAWESRVMITALANIGPVAGYRSRRWDSFYTLPWVDYSGGGAEPKPEPPVTGDYIEYTVVKGDTPWALAVRFLGAGARYTEIMATNGLKIDANIYVGQILKIPVKGGTAPVDPPKPPEPPAFIHHTVVKGDTPWGLAIKYLGAGARYTEIMQASGLKNDATIYVEQILKIPVKGGTAPPPTEPPAVITHTVIKGDTPWGLAAKYLGNGQRYPEIMQLNDLAKDANIYVGQVLLIPSRDGTPSAPAPKPPVFQPYRVIVDTKNGLNVRDGPSTANKILRVFCNGTLVMIDEEKSGWGYVASVKGWISLDFTVKA